MTQDTITPLENEAAYQAFCQEIIDCRDGYRGWVGITRAVKATGMNRGQLITVAKAAGLKVSHGGVHGYTASR